jgi:acyl-CoA thioesterase-1
MKFQHSKLRIELSSLGGLFFIMLVCCGQPQPNNQSQTLPPEGTPAPVTRTVSEKKIVFFGNSLTAGYGLDEHESFPSLIQQRLDSLNLKYEVVNAGLSGETSAGGLSRIDWTLNQQVDIFVLELGANDVLRGLDLKSTKQNLQGIIDQVRQKDESITIILAGMKAPPNMGSEYAVAFEKIYIELSEENKIPLIPFLLENVGGIPALNIEDGKHPNAAGQKIVANNVWQVLGPLVGGNQMKGN